MYDEDNELKKQMDSLLKKEEHLQKLFEEKEEALGKRWVGRHALCFSLALATGPIRELYALRSSLQKTYNELEKQLRLMTFEQIRLHGGGGGL